LDDGKLVKWDDATEHVLAHTLHYGLGAFEGIRSYARSPEAGGGASIFRLGDHIDRLFESCHIATLDIRSRAPICATPASPSCARQASRAYIGRSSTSGSARSLGTTESPVKVVVALRVDRRLHRRRVAPARDRAMSPAFPRAPSTR